VEELKDDVCVPAYVMPGECPSVLSIERRTRTLGYNYVSPHGRDCWMLTPSGEVIFFHRKTDTPYLVSGDPACAPQKLTEQVMERAGIRLIDGDTYVRLDRPAPGLPAAAGEVSDPESDGELPQALLRPERPVGLGGSPSAAARSPAGDSHGEELELGDREACPSDGEDEAPPDDLPDEADMLMKHGRRDRKRIATSTEHLALHMEKNPQCESCDRGKTRNVRHVPGTFPAEA
jgi:hypothetical protein